MRGDWTMEKAKPAAAPEITRLARASLPGYLCRYTIWASPRAGRYVKAILDGAFSQEQHEFYLACQANRGLALAALRLVEGQAFLNHLYVEPRFRGRGLGAWLLAEAARRYLARHPAERVALDVFASAGAPEAWYARLGFRERQRITWWAQPRARRHGRPLPSTVPRFVKADRQHRAWGFSSFIARTPGGRCYRVGRLYRPYFRLVCAEAARDRELEQLLLAQDPARRLLLVTADPYPPPHWKQVAASRRLECDAAALLDRLAAARHA